MRRKRIQEADAALPSSYEYNQSCGHGNQEAHTPMAVRGITRTSPSTSTEFYEYGIALEPVRIGTDNALLADERRL